MNGEPMLFFLAEFAGDAEDICPRGVLRRVIKRAGDLGYDVYSALEYEFFVFEETPHSVRERTTRTSRAGRPATSAIRSCAAR